MYRNRFQGIIQLLTDHSFRKKLVEKTLQKFHDSKMSSTTNMTYINSVDLWLTNQMISNYKAEEKTVTNIVEKHVLQTSPDQEVRLIVYCKTRKLTNIVIKNRAIEEADPNKRDHKHNRWM